MKNNLWRTYYKEIEFFDVTGGSRKVEKICAMILEVGNQKHNEQMKMWTQSEP